MKFKKSVILFLSFFIAAAVTVKSADSPFTPLGDSIKAVAEKIRPAVVYIVIKEGSQYSGYRHFDRWYQFDEDGDFPNSFFEQKATDRKRKTPQIPEVPPSGSGLIISKDGYILTNFHVAGGEFSKLEVVLDNNETYDAKLIGFFKRFDLAVIKIDVKRDLPFCELGNSDDLDIGETVIAVGSPLRLRGTVTSGIISVKDRTITMPEFGRSKGMRRQAGLIQTSTPINPGNSGGPLISIKTGKVIGVNTARTGSEGLGFAVAINLAKKFLPLMLKGEKNADGCAWMGIQLQTLNPDLAEAFKVESGVIVTDIVEDGPADKAKIQVGDIILKIEDKKISSPEDLISDIALRSKNEKVKLSVLKNGAISNVDVILASGIEEDADIPKSELEDKEEEDKEEASEIQGTLIDWLGIKLAEKDGNVEVAEVVPSGVAEKYGIMVGDTIKKADNANITNIKDFQDNCKKEKLTKGFVLLIKRIDAQRFLFIK